MDALADAGAARSLEEVHAMDRRARAVARRLIAGGS